MEMKAVAVREALDFLGQARRLWKVIENKRLRIGTLRDMAASTTGQMSDMPRSDSPNLQRMETFLCKAADLEKEIIADEAELERARQKISEAICEVPDAQDQQVLYYRYVECAGWTAVAVECGCHLRTAHRHHDSGVAHLAEIMAGKPA